MSPKGRPTGFLKCYLGTIRNQVAYCLQAQVCQVATETNPHFVTSFEGGRNDGGVLLGSIAIGDDITERYVTTVDTDNGEQDVVTVEVKSLSPRADTNKSVTWGYRFTQSQLDSCQAVILISPKDPDYVALVPIHCIRHNERSTRTVFVSQPFRPLWTLHPLPAFPPELAPFIRPLAQLGEALAHMRDVTNASLQASNAVITEHW